MTDECIDAIYKAGTQNYELLLIDNGSIPGYVADHINATLIRNEINLGFPKAINQGVKAAKGDIVVLLNNDVIVTSGWTEKLIRALGPYSIVGPMTNYCAGLQRVTIPCYQNEQELNEQATKWEDEYAGEIQEVNWVIGFCMAFKKSLWDEVGPFDESLWPCSGEELIFCMDARKKGHRIGIVKDCYVHHYGSQTFKTMDVDYNAICKRNDANIAAKHGKDFWIKQAIEEGI